VEVGDIKTTGFSQIQKKENQKALAKAGLKPGTFFFALCPPAKAGGKLNSQRWRLCCGSFAERD